MGRKSKNRSRSMASSDVLSLWLTVFKMGLRIFVFVQCAGRTGTRKKTAKLSDDLRSYGIVDLIHMLKIHPKNSVAHMEFHCCLLEENSVMYKSFCLYVFAESGVVCINVMQSICSIVKITIVVAYPWMDEMRVKEGYNRTVEIHATSSTK